MPRLLAVIVVLPPSQVAHALFILKFILFQAAALRCRGIASERRGLQKQD
jgi:hypothetical protein